MTGFLLIDGNNIAMAANSAKPLKAGDMPTTAIYGFLRTLRPMVKTFGALTPVVLWDGASWRAMVFAEYKASRKKVPTTKAEIKAALAKDETKQQVPHIRKALRMLGVKQMFALNYEADDLAGLMVQKYAGRKIVMITGDKDWIQLVGPNRAWIDPQRDERLTLTTLPNRLGWFPDKAKGKGDLGLGPGQSTEGFISVPSPRAWLEMKCLMGDISDDIPGVGGIGKKGAIEFIRDHKSFATFMNGYIDKTLDAASLPKKFADFASSDEKQELWRRNMRLMDLTTSERPMPVNLTIDKGEFDPAAFDQFCKELSFTSIRSDLEDWTAPFNPVPAEEAA